MDRYVLTALVREIAPRILGRRARGLTLWGVAGFFVPFPAKPKVGLVVSLAVDAPGMYWGLPIDQSDVKPPQRLAKLLTGAELVNAGVASSDRVVRLEWRRTKPSGIELRLELFLEWLGTRNAAYLIDTRSKKVLDFISPGIPRLSTGATFEPLRPPHGVRPLAADATDFLERLGDGRGPRRAERRAVREASGLSPLLADEVLYLHSQRGYTLEGAFDVVIGRLRRSRPVLYRPRVNLRDNSARYRLSPIQLEQWGKGEEFSTWNEGAATFIGEASRLSSARRRFRDINTRLRKRMKRQKVLLARLEHDRAGLEDPERMRRWGELLLAGLTQARRVEGGVEVPDPYHPNGERVRVPLNSRLDLLANAERYFQRARKVERGLEKMTSRMSMVKNEIAYLETVELTLDNADRVEDLEDLAAELRETGILPPRHGKDRGRSVAAARLGPRRFESSHGGVILVGRSARSNEELTFDIARPEEMWFHAADAAGAHVVLRRDRGGQASREEIEEAAAVAAYYSKSRAATSVEVVYAPRKHVRKLRGAPPGTVKLSRFRSIRVRPALPAQSRESDPSSVIGNRDE